MISKIIKESLNKRLLESKEDNTLFAGYSIDSPRFNDMVRSVSFYLDSLIKSKNSGEAVNNTVLSDDAELDKFCLDVATNIYKNISKVYNIDSYTVHNTIDGGDIVSNILQRGKELSRTSGKDFVWNPSNLFLVREYAPSKTEKSDLISFNRYIHNKDYKNSDVIGICLNDSTTLHGSYSLNKLATYLGVDYKSKFDTVVESSRGAFKTYITKIKKKFEGDERLYFQASVIDEYKSVEGIKDVDYYLDDIIDNLVAIESSESGSTSGIFQILKFMSEIDDIDLVIQYIALIAKSVDIRTCPHYKIVKGKMELVNPEFVFSDVELDKIRIRVNGENDVIFEVLYNKKKMKIQLTSKDRYPAFLLMKKFDKVDNVQKLSKLKI